MALYLLVTVLSISSMFSRTSSLGGDHHHLPNGYFEEESGYDFQAHPSNHFGPVEEGVKFYNNSIKAGRGGFPMISGKLKGRSLVESVKTVDVTSYGAKGDGNTDDTKSFQNAWSSACSSSSDVNFVVPRSSKGYLLRPIRFSGPCKSDIAMQIVGKLMASGDRSDYNEDSRHWLIFDSVQNLMVQGGGTIDGNGNVWWQNSCKVNKAKPCKDAPTAMTFYRCTNLEVKNLKIQNAQQIHVSFERSTDVQVSNLVISSPEKSPNTDGIHVTGTQNIQISGCTIGTGDDCISIVSGSQKVHANDITCGPGHGISIGSLGARNAEAHVSDVVVNGAKLSGTTNGVRIKTWQGGSGSASDIKFQNIEMQNVKNPIIIDQNYCDQEGPCKEQSSAVQVRNVLYQNIKGTSATKVAVDFDCSKSHPCQGLALQNVNLVGGNGANAEATCKNVNLQYSGSVSPRCA